MVAMSPAPRYPTNCATDSAEAESPSEGGDPPSVRVSVSPSSSMYPEAGSGAAGNDPVEEPSEPSSAPSPPESDVPASPRDPWTVSVASDMVYSEAYVDPGIPISEAEVEVPEDVPADVPSNVHVTPASAPPDVSDEPCEPPPWSVVSRISPWSPCIPTNKIVDVVHKPPYYLPSSTPQHTPNKTDTNRTSINNPHPPRSYHNRLTGEN